MIIILRRKFNSPENLIYIAFASAFAPFVFSGIVLIAMGSYLLISRQYRKEVFSHSGYSVMIIFTVYTAFIGLVRDNFLGVVCSLGFFLIIVIGYFTRSVITGDIFQRALDICCYMCILVFFSVVGERMIYSHIEDYRCNGWFFNSNYLCTMMAIMVIVCVYKILITVKARLFYLFIAVLCLVSMYFGGSIFAFVEAAIGIFTMLILYKRRKLLAVVTVLFLAVLVAVYIEPDIFPRILNSNHSTELRIKVWDSSLEFLKLNPLFGNGFLSYYHLHNSLGSLYETTHTHNFLFESVLSFGVFGTLIFLIFIWSYYEKVSECKSLLRKNKSTNLILAISAGVIIHCTIDLTILWIQTGLLFVLILSGIGVDEKVLNRRIKACLAKSEKLNNSSKEEVNNG